MQRRSLLTTLLLLLVAIAAIIAVLGGLSDLLHAWDELYNWVRGGAPIPPGFLTNRLLFLILLIVLAVAMVLLRRLVPAIPQLGRAETAPSPGQTVIVKVGPPPVVPVPAAPRSRLQAPSPPEAFAGRTQQIEEISEWLLGGDRAAGPGLAVAITAAVQGMGGVGKTSLALRLAQDMAPHFAGGVLWLRVGFEAAQGDLLDRLALDIDLDLRDEPALERRAARIQHELGRGGRLLALVDDLWDVDLGRWLLRDVLPADRALLLTTRDLSLGRALCNHVERLDVLPEQEALALLANILGPPGTDEAAAQEVIGLVEGLPLALDLAARLCENGPADLVGLAVRLRERPALDILKLEGAETRESSVEACLALSYKPADAEFQRRFRALGVLAPAPYDLLALAAVWGDESLEVAGESA